MITIFQVCVGSFIGIGLFFLVFGALANTVVEDKKNKK